MCDELCLESGIICRNLDAIMWFLICSPFNIIFLQQECVWSFSGVNAVFTRLSWQHGPDYSSALAETAL